MGSMTGDGVQAATAHVERGDADGDSDPEASPAVRTRETDAAPASTRAESVCEPASTTASASAVTKRKTQTVLPAVLPWSLPVSSSRLITASLLPGPQQGGDPRRSPPFVRSSDGVAYLPASSLLPPPRRLRPQVEQQLCQFHAPSEGDRASLEHRAASSSSSSLFDPFAASPSSTYPWREGTDSLYPTAHAAESPASVRDAAPAETVNAFLLQRARRVQAGRSHRNASTSAGRPQQFLQQVLLQQQPVRRRAGLEEPSTGLAASADILGVVDQLRQVLDRLEGSDTLFEGRSTVPSHDATEESTALLRPHCPTATRASLGSLPATSPSARQTRRQRQQQQRQDLQDLRQLIFKIADLTISDPASWASANASGGPETDENDLQSQVRSPTEAGTNTEVVGEAGASTAPLADPASPSGGSSGPADAAGNLGSGSARQSPVNAQSTAPAPTVTPASAQQNVLLFLGYGGGALLVRTLMVKETALASDEPNGFVSGVGIFAELKELLIYVKNECMYLLRELAISNMQLAAICAWNPELMRLLFEMIESPVTFDSSELLLEELVSSREGLLSARQGCPQWFQHPSSTLPQSASAQLRETSRGHGEAGVSVARPAGGTETQHSPLADPFSSASSPFRSGQVRQTNFVARLSMRHVAVMTRLLSLLLFERDDRHACEDTLSLLQIPRADAEHRQGRERRKQRKRQKRETEERVRWRQAASESDAEPEDRPDESRRSVLKAKGEERPKAQSDRPATKGKSDSSATSSSSSSSSRASGREDSIWNQSDVDDSRTSTDEAEEEEPKYPYIFPSLIQPVYSSRENVGRLLRRALDRRLRGESQRLRSSSPSAASGEGGVLDGGASDARDASGERRRLLASWDASCSTCSPARPRSDEREGMESVSLAKEAPNGAGGTEQEEQGDVFEADAYAFILQGAPRPPASLPAHAGLELEPSRDEELPRSRNRSPGSSTSLERRGGSEFGAGDRRGEETLPSGNGRSQLETRGRSRRRQRPACRHWSESPSRRTVPAALYFDAWRGRWTRRADAASDRGDRREGGTRAVWRERPWIEQRFNRPSCLALDRQLYVDVHTQSTPELLRELDDGAGRREARTLRCCPLAATGLFHSASCDVCLVGNQRAILDCPQLLERLVDLLALQVLPLPACISGLTCGNMPGVDSANALIQRLSQSTTPLFEEALGLASLPSSSSASVSSASASHAVRASPHAQPGASGSGQGSTSSAAARSQPTPRSQAPRTLTREATQASPPAAASLPTAPSSLEAVPGEESLSESASGNASVPGAAASHQPAGRRDASNSGQTTSGAPGGVSRPSPSVWRRLSSFVTGNRSSAGERRPPSSDASVSSSSSSASSAERRSSRAEGSASQGAPGSATGPELAASHGSSVGQVSATITLEFTPEGLLMVPGVASSGAAATDDGASWALSSAGGSDGESPAETPAEGGDSFAAPAGGEALSPSATLLPASSGETRTAAEEGLSAIPTFVPSPAHRTRTMRVIPEPVQFPRITFPVAAVVEARHRSRQAALEASPGLLPNSQRETLVPFAPAASGSAETEVELAAALAAMGGFVWFPRAFGAVENPATVLPLTAAGHPIVYLPESFTTGGTAATFSPFVLVLPRPSSQPLASPDAASPGQEDSAETASSGASSPSSSDPPAASSGSSAADYLWNLLSLGSNASLPSLPEPAVSHAAPQASGASSEAPAATPASPPQAGQPSVVVSSFPSVPFPGGVANASGARTVVQVMVQAVAAVPGNEDFFPSALLGAQMPARPDAQLASSAFPLSLPFAGAAGAAADASAAHPSSSLRPAPAGAGANSTDSLAAAPTNRAQSLTGGATANRWTFVPETGWMASTSGTGGHSAELAAGAGPVGVSSFDFAATRGVGDILGEGLSTTLWTTEDLEDLSSLQAGGDGAQQGTQRDLEQLQRVLDQAFEGYRSQRRAVKREARAARERHRRERRGVDEDPLAGESPERALGRRTLPNAAERVTRNPPAPDAATSAAPEPALCSGINLFDSRQGTHASNASARPSSSASSRSSSCSSSSVARRRPRRSWFADAGGSAGRSAKGPDGAGSGRDEVASRRSTGYAAPECPGNERGRAREGPTDSSRCMRIHPKGERSSDASVSRVGAISSSRAVEPEETGKGADGAGGEAEPPDGNVFTRLLRRLSSSFFMSRTSESRAGDRWDTADANSRREGRPAEGADSPRAAASEAAVETKESQGGVNENGGEGREGGRSRSPSHAVGGARRGSRDRQRGEALRLADPEETEDRPQIQASGSGQAPQPPPCWGGSASLVSPASSSSRPRTASVEDADGLGEAAERRTGGEDGIVCSGRSAVSGLFPCLSISSSSFPLLPSLERSYSTLSAESLQDTDFRSFSEALPGDMASFASLAPAPQTAEWRLAEERGGELPRRGDDPRGREEGRGLGGTGGWRVKTEGDSQARAQGESKARPSQPVSGLTERERARMRRYILRLERRKRMERTEATREQRGKTERSADGSPTVSAGGDEAKSETDPTRDVEGRGETPHAALPSGLSRALLWARGGPKRHLEAARRARSLGASGEATSEEEKGDGRGERLASEGSTDGDSSRRSEDSSRDQALSLSSNATATLTSSWSSSSDSSFMSTSTEDEADETIKLLRLERKALPSDFEFLSSLTARRKPVAGRKRSEDNFSTSSSPSNALNFFRAPRRRPTAARGGADTASNGGDALASRKEKEHRRPTRKDPVEPARGNAGEKRQTEGEHREQRRQRAERQPESDGDCEQCPQSDWRRESKGRAVPPNLDKREYGCDEDPCNLGTNPADDGVAERSDRDDEGRVGFGADERPGELSAPSPETTGSLRSASREQLFPSVRHSSIVRSSSSSSVPLPSSSASAPLPSSSSSVPLPSSSSSVPLPSSSSSVPLPSSSSSVPLPSSSSSVPLPSSSSSRRLPEGEPSASEDGASAISPLRASETQARPSPAPSHRPSPSAAQPPNPSSSVSASSVSSRVAGGAPAQATGPLVFDTLPETRNVISFVPRVVGDGDAAALAALGAGQLGGGAMSVDFMLATALSALAQAAARSNNEWLHVLLNGLVQHFASPNRSYVLRIASLCQHQPEQYFVICGLLAGRFRNEVQQRLNQRRFLPLLSQLFDTLVWFAPVPSREKKSRGKGRGYPPSDRDFERGAETTPAAPGCRGGEARSPSQDGAERQEDDLEGEDPLKLACESSLCGLTVEFLRVIHDVCDFESGTVASATKRQLLTVHEKNVVMHSLRRIRRVDIARDGRPPCCIRVVRRRAAVVHPHPMMCVSRSAQEREDEKARQERKRETHQRRRGRPQPEDRHGETGNSEGDGDPKPLDAIDTTPDVASDGTPWSPHRDPPKAASSRTSSVSSLVASSRSSSVSSRSSSVSLSPPDACGSDPASDGGGYGGAGGLGSGSVHQSGERHPRVMTRYVFKGTSGLLTKLIAVYASESCASVYKFWLASSIEACIRGGDPLLKIFAAERGLLHVLLRDIVKIARQQHRVQALQSRRRLRRASANQNDQCGGDAAPSDEGEREPGRDTPERADGKARSPGPRGGEDGRGELSDADGVDAALSPFHPSPVHRGILQSCCDLLGELIKFNPYVLHMLNVYLASRPRTLALLLNVLVENLVDSNVLLRSLYLTIEFCRQVRHLHCLLVGAARTALRAAAAPASPLPLWSLGDGPGLVGPREAALVTLPARLLRVMKVSPSASLQNALGRDGLSLPPPALLPASGGDSGCFPVSPAARRSIQLQALEAAMNDPLRAPPLLSPKAPLAFPPRPSILQTRYSASAFGAPYSRGPSLAAAATAAAATLASGPDDMGYAPAAHGAAFGRQGEPPSEPSRSRIGDAQASAGSDSLSRDVDDALVLLKKELLPLWRAVHVFERNANNPYALHAAEDPSGLRRAAASPRARRGAHNAVAAAARALAGGRDAARGETEKRHRGKTERRQGETLPTCDRFGMPHQFSDCCVRGWHAAPSGLSLPFVEGPSLRSLLARSETQRGRRQTQPCDEETRRVAGEDQNGQDAKAKESDRVRTDRACEEADGEFDAASDQFHGPSATSRGSRPEPYPEGDSPSTHEAASLRQVAASSLSSRCGSSPFPASVDLAEAAAKGGYWQRAPLRDARADLRVEVSAAMADNALKKCRELHAVFRTKYAVDIEDVVPDVGSEAEAQRPLFLFCRLQRTALIKKLMCVVPFDTVAPDTICCVNSCLLLLLLALLDGELEETLDTVRRDLAEEEAGGCPVLARQARGAWPSPPAAAPHRVAPAATSLLFRICRDAGNVPTLLSAAHASCRRCRRAALDRLRARRERTDTRREGQRKKGEDAGRGRTRAREEKNGEGPRESRSPGRALSPPAASLGEAGAAEGRPGRRLRGTPESANDDAERLRGVHATKRRTGGAGQSLAAGGDFLHCAAHLLRQHEEGTGGLARDKKHLRGMSLPVHNFWCLLHFWQLHYSRRATDARGLEFSCQIPLALWHELVTILGGKSTERSSLAFREDRRRWPAKASERKTLLS
ncbi:conserved hypothetical protein [Neospora caninum Liverpool]|uniref:Uncharacterized protein n=1 Tax=Neospora caninum (strain Liverpool) TaxID=572307 RepID=F0VBI0_NEOCL|nr:conserved hypothetical protein [Neospora caninum Liverpool]CBZ50964.1 conserved hypothetical protein [Neospora caninum Liverpool]CEL68266.1 TPA: hypothetical protein BN1204_040390 [Neospora caninum Liverpool]|eukprot:XP_003880997.1 conserved hypothetical protein [Neospora caninum Liverpool]